MYSLKESDHHTPVKVNRTGRASKRTPLESCDSQQNNGKRNSNHRFHGKDEGDRRSEASSNGDSQRICGLNTHNNHRASSISSTGAMQFCEPDENSGKEAKPGEKRCNENNSVRPSLKPKIADSRKSFLSPTRASQAREEEISREYFSHGKTRGKPRKYSKDKDEQATKDHHDITGQLPKSRCSRTPQKSSSAATTTRSTDKALLSPVRRVGGGFSSPPLDEAASVAIRSAKKHKQHRTMEVLSSEPDTTLYDVGPSHPSSSSSYVSEMQDKEARRKSEGKVGTTGETEEYCDRILDGSPITRASRTYSKDREPRRGSIGNSRNVSTESEEIDQEKERRNSAHSVLLSPESLLERSGTSAANDNDMLSSVYTASCKTGFPIASGKQETSEPSKETITTVDRFDMSTVKMPYSSDYSNPDLNREGMANFTHLSSTSLFLRFEENACEHNGFKLLEQGVNSGSPDNSAVSGGFVFCETHKPDNDHASASSQDGVLTDPVEADRTGISKETSIVKTESARMLFGNLECKEVSATALCPATRKRSPPNLSNHLVSEGDDNLVELGCATSPAAGGYFNDHNFADRMHIGKETVYSATYCAYFTTTSSATLTNPTIEFIAPAATESTNCERTFSTDSPKKDCATSDAAESTSTDITVPTTKFAAPAATDSSNCETTFSSDIPKTDCAPSDATESTSTDISVPITKFVSPAATDSSNCETTSSTNFPKKECAPSDTAESTSTDVSLPSCADQFESSCIAAAATSPNCDSKQQFAHSKGVLSNGLFPNDRADVTVARGICLEGGVKNEMTNEEEVSGYQDTRVERTVEEKSAKDNNYGEVLTKREMHQDTNEGASSGNHVVGRKSLSAAQAAKLWYSVSNESAGAKRATTPSDAQPERSAVCCRITDVTFVSSLFSRHAEYHLQTVVQHPGKVSVFAHTSMRYSSLKHLYFKLLHRYSVLKTPTAPHFPRSSPLPTWRKDVIDSRSEMFEKLLNYIVVVHQLWKDDEELRCFLNIRN